jgi:hypothetical protein
VPFKVIWEFGDGGSNSEVFDNVLDAREQAYTLSTRFAREHGRCTTQLFDGDELVFELRENSFL